MKRIFAFILLLSLTLSAVAREQKRVLVISHYKLSSAWSQTYLSPVIDLDSSHPELSMIYFTAEEVLMDVKTYQSFVHSIIDFFDDEAPELVVIVGSSNFMIAPVVDEAWPGVPIVMCGEFNYMCSWDYVTADHPSAFANRTMLQSLVPRMNMTLVQNPVYFDATLDLMQSMTPNLGMVVFIGGDDYFSRECEVTMKRTVESRGLKFMPFDTSERSRDELSKLGKNVDLSTTAFCYKSSFSKAVKTFVRKDFEDEIPLFYMHNMDYKGNVGGLGFHSYSFEEYHNTLTGVLNKVLFEKVSPRDIPFEVIPSGKPQVNVTAVKHFDYDVDLIPQGAELVRIPPTLWEQYHEVILLIVFMSTLLLMAACFAVYSHRKRHKLLAAKAEIERVNNELAAAKERAQNDSRMKSVFLQNMGHDIRNPINAIVGFSQILGMPDVDLTEEDKARCNEYISNNAELLLMLMEDILNVADVENGVYNIEVRPSQCNAICNASMKSVEGKVPRAVKMYLTSNVDDEYCIETDPRRVQQILINFLTNACKHTFDGEIHVHCEVDESRGKVEFSVADTGTGIPPEMAKDIFERFKKLDNIEGHGIGLNICSTISEKLGGEVRLDTSYTNGARFVLEIALKSGDAVE